MAQFSVEVFFGGRRQTLEGADAMEKVLIVVAAVLFIALVTDIAPVSYTHLTLPTNREV